MEQSKFVDRFTMFAAKLGNQVHLRSLRDAFSALMPMFILAGLAVLINSVILPNILQGDQLNTAQFWGRMITNGTLNISSILITPMIAFYLARNKGFQNPISAIVVGLSVLVVMLPFYVTVTPVGADEAVKLSGVIDFNSVGNKAMFGGIIIGLLATEAFIFFSNIKFLQIELKGDIPPAVAQSFFVMIPVMLVMSLFGLVSLGLFYYFDTNLLDLITKFIQEPLRNVNTSIWGVIVIYSLGNFLFTIGIHQAVINSSILMPFAMINMNENMMALEQGLEIPHIITNTFIPTFGMIGGTGSTISLIIATMIFGRHQSTKSIAKLGAAPGLFNINEPIIFGYPIVFNIPLMIPFVLLPTLGVVFAYVLTSIGWLSKTIVMIPWTTPPLLSGYLATGGDWRAVVVQFIIIVFGVFLYLPFMKLSEKTSEKLSELEATE